MFRIAFVGLMFFVLGALFFGPGAGLALGAGWLLLLPVLFFFKIALFMLLFGAVGRAMWRRNGGPAWDRSRWEDGRPRAPWAHDRGGASSSRGQSGRSTEDRFEEWHRLAHAREEVDGWVPDLGNGENG